MPQKRKTISFKPCHCCCKWRCDCLIPRISKPHPPFNSETKSESMVGLHPRMQAFAPASPAVGSYDPRAIDRKPGIHSWKGEEGVKIFSATMNDRILTENLIEKNLMRTGRGPGTHEILRWPESTLLGSCRGLQRDLDFGTVPRFEPSYKSTTPGPGYTLRVHNPYYYLEQKKLKGSSRVPSFEFDGLIPRFRETRRSWSLPCNRYNVKHPKSLQVFLDKVTGKRGFYDIFTGPRDDTTIKGYRARGKVQNYDSSLKLTNIIETLTSRSNYFKGKWSVAPRFLKKPVARMMLQDISTCYKDPDEPGPGRYNPRTPRIRSSLKRYPFDSNIEHARPSSSSDIHPGPDRYNVRGLHRVKGDGWTCVFKSKVPRTIGVVIPASYSDF